MVTPIAPLLEQMTAAEIMEKANALQSLEILVPAESTPPRNECYLHKLWAWSCRPAGEGIGLQWLVDGEDVTNLVTPLMNPVGQSSDQSYWILD